jgi:hypothetical protein
VEQNKCSFLGIYATSNGNETDFANSKYKVVNRGFGGSQTSDANKLFDRVVMPHKPKFIFFYEGDNDIGSGKSVDTVWADFNTFYQKVKTQLPKTKVVFKASTAMCKSIFLTFITTFGLAQNEYAGSLAQNSLTMDALFDY